jgi:hypothetical protein
LQQNEKARWYTTSKALIIYDKVLGLVKKQKNAFSRFRLSSRVSKSGPNRSDFLHTPASSLAKRASRDKPPCAIQAQLLLDFSMQKTGFHIFANLFYGNFTFINTRVAM